MTIFVYYNRFDVIILGNKDLRTRTPMSNANAIDIKLLEALKIYSNDTGIPISKLLDKALELFL
jgi:hypothetical protein